MSSEVKAVGSLASLYAFRMLGLFMVLPVLTLYVDDYSGATPLLMGLALGIYGLTQAALQIPLGILSDFIGRKPVIVGGLVLFALGSIVAAMADSAAGLILGRAMQGGGAIASTVMALVSDVTSEQNRTKAMAAIGGSIGLSFVLAMILGPLLAGFGGLSYIFYLSALLSLVGIGIVVLLVPSPRKQVFNRDSSAVPTIMLSVLKNTELLRLDIGIFILHALLMASFLVLPVIIEVEMGVPAASHWMIYLALFGLSMAVVFPLIIVGEKRRKIKTVFLGAIVCLVAALTSLAFWDNPILFWLMVFVFFASFNLLEACLPSLISKIAPAGAKGSAMGVYSTSQFMGAFVGGAGGGAVLTYFGAQGVFVAGSLLACVWLVSAMSMKKPRHLSNWQGAFQGRSLVGERSVTAFYTKVLAVGGVREAVWSPDEKQLYLKIEKAHFDEKTLRALIQEAL